MTSGESTIADWVNLPEGVSELSLWSTLHDGDLIAIESDLLARTLTLRFDVGYVRSYRKLIDETRFVVAVGGVQSVRALSSTPWPGGCQIPDGTPCEQQQTIVAEYQSKWREESLSWAEFERLISKGLEVSSATLGQGLGGVVLRMGLLVGGGSYVETYIRGEDVAFSIGERQLTAEEFVELGEAYWEAFASRSGKG
ncbi:MAG: hypothetical protein ABSA85_13395 [Terracidiphilus sp.]|jgi:hypothetical protein